MSQRLKQRRLKPYYGTKKSFPKLFISANITDFNVFNFYMVKWLFMLLKSQKNVKNYYIKLRFWLHNICIWYSIKFIFEKIDLLNLFNTQQIEIWCWTERNTHIQKWQQNYDNIKWLQFSYNYLLLLLK